MKVFFDVDGVLIDGWHVRPERRKPWDAKIEEDLGLHGEAFRAALFNTPVGAHKSLMYACVSGEIDLKEVLVAVLPTVGYDGSVDTLVTYWFEKDSNVNADVLDAVKRLGRHDHVELYLATGQEHYRAAYLWNDLGFKAHFRDIFYSARIRYSKMTPDFFDKVNTELGIGPGESPIFFDDSEIVVQLARKAGWDACLFDSAEDVQRHKRLQNLLRD